MAVHTGSCVAVGPFVPALRQVREGLLPVLDALGTPGDGVPWLPNDSMDVRGAFKDRHQKIGDGYIGLGAFEELFAHPATAGVPFVLETPGSRDADDPQIGLLQKLRER